jgi:hypothetical protein
VAVLVVSVTNWYACVGVLGAYLLAVYVVLFNGGLLHVDRFAHNKSGIAYQDKSRRPETIYKREPHQQVRLLVTNQNSIMAYSHGVATA